MNENCMTGNHDRCYSAVGYISPSSTIVPGEASAPLTCPFSNAQVKLRCHRLIKPFLERNCEISESPLQPDPEPFRDCPIRDLGTDALELRRGPTAGLARAF